MFSDHPQANSTVEEPKTAILKSLWIVLNLNVTHTLGNFLADCFADIDDTPPNVLIPQETRTLLKLVDLKPSYQDIAHEDVRLRLNYFFAEDAINGY